jgi:GAF domain-containing protein
MTGEAETHDIVRRRRLAIAMAQLAEAEGEADLVAALLAHARFLAGADGVAIARREDEDVRYIAEDAMAPLWAGRVFPIDYSVSGTAMLQNRPILIPDVHADRRVPLPAYESTFVRRVAVFPIGTPRPLLALGACWSEAGPIPHQAVDTLTSLAAAARRALEIVHGTAWPRARRFAHG